MPAPQTALLFSGPAAKRLFEAHQGRLAEYSLGSEQCLLPICTADVLEADVAQPSQGLVLLCPRASPRLSMDLPALSFRHLLRGL